MMLKKRINVAAVLLPTLYKCRTEPTMLRVCVYTSIGSLDFSWVDS